MTKLIIKSFIGVIIFSLCLAGLNTGVVRAGKSINIAYVNISRVFDQYQHTIDAEAELDVLKAEKQKELDKRLVEVREMKDEAETLAKSEKEKKQGIIDEKLKELKKRNKEIKTRLVKTRDKRVKEILKEIRIFIAQYADKKKYDFIFTDKVLIYKNKDYDLSQEIIKKINEQYKKAKK